MIYIDTGAFLARYAKRDQHYVEAVAIWDELSHQAIPCFTSSLVLSETFTLLARRTDYRFAAARARQLCTSNVLQILRPDQNDDVAAIIQFEKFADQSVSFCDCMSFALMRRLGISDVFSFDEHFATAGFNLRSSYSN